MRLYCFECGKPVTNDIPDAVIFRAIAQCPECIDKHTPEHEPLNICGIPVVIVQNMPDAHYQWGFMSHKDAVRAAEIIDLAIGHILEELGR